jgi:integration host factor subunit beta
MNKSELVEKLAERAKITKKRAELVVNLVFDQMAQALKRGERIEIRGFGSFTSKAYEAYTGRNPRTGRNHPRTRQALAILQGWQGAEGTGRLSAGGAYERSRWGPDRWRRRR